MKILEAARMRNDLVARRLEQVDHQLFIYHMNNKCYKSCTHKKTLTKLEEESSKATEESESKTFTYWDQLIEMVRLAKDLVRADREGDQHLHLHSTVCRSRIAILCCF